MQLIETPKAKETREYRMLVGGEWVDALSSKTFESVNPYTGKVWATAPEAGEEDVDRAVRAAREAFDAGPWGKMTGTERARLIRRLAELIAENAESLALFESTDNGKLLKEMRQQLNAMPEWYYYFAGAADKIHGETIPSDKANFLVYTRREPIGVVGAVVPWNSPSCCSPGSRASPCGRVYLSGETRRADPGLDLRVCQALRGSRLPIGGLQRRNRLRCTYGASARAAYRC